MLAVMVVRAVSARLGSRRAMVVPAAPMQMGRTAVDRWVGLAASRLLAAMALRAAVLKAADNADLVPYSPQTIERALAAWQLSVPPGVDAVTMLREWWETYELDHPPFRVALAALDAMVG